MTAQALPIAPFTKEEPWQRGQDRMICFYGINDIGLYFTYHQEVELDPETKLTARWILEMKTETDNYGVTKPIRNDWVRKLYNQHAGFRYVKIPDEPRIPAETSHADMVLFCAMFGISIGYHSNNGFIVNNLGYAGKPLFDFDPATGKYTRKPDAAYGEKLFEAPSGLYGSAPAPSTGTSEEPPQSSLT